MRLEEAGAEMMLYQSLFIILSSIYDASIVYIYIYMFLLSNLSVYFLLPLYLFISFHFYIYDLFLSGPTSPHVFPPNFPTLGSQVRRQKQEAVAREDYDRAMELKELEKQLENQRQRPTKMARSETVNQ